MENRHSGHVRLLVKDIVLTTINAKWIHPSLALRLLKANLGPLEEACEIIEFALRQPLREKVETLLCLRCKQETRPRILGISVSIWNHSATLELLAELEKAWAANLQSKLGEKRPVIVLGGPEVSHLPQDAEIFKFADYVIRGEGEIAFRELCEKILTAEQGGAPKAAPRKPAPQFINAVPVNLSEIKSAYHLYADEDIANKLIYVEASRGCPFNCEFCLSAVKDAKHDTLYSSTDNEQQPHSLLPTPHSPVPSPQSQVHEFPIEPFLAQMDALVSRGVKTFKFLDRTFNLNITRAQRICEFFLEQLAQGKTFVVHFEMVPSLFPAGLLETLSRFPPGTLRLEVGIQTLNADAAALISRPSNPENELAALCLLREKTNAIIHADLIAGLPGEDLASFGEGFDRLWLALSGAAGENPRDENGRVEIQPGILKLLPGAPIVRRSEAFAMRYNSQPPYEVEETSFMSAEDLRRVKNFARFWELIVNRSQVKLCGKNPIFDKFMSLSDFLLVKYGRNWGIDRGELAETAQSFLKID